MAAAAVRARAARAVAAVTTDPLLAGALALARDGARVAVAGDAVLAGVRADALGRAGEGSPAVDPFMTRVPADAADLARHPRWADDDRRTGEVRASDVTGATGTIVTLRRAPADGRSREGELLQAAQGGLSGVAQVRRPARRPLDHGGVAAGHAAEGAESEATGRHEGERR